MNVVEIAKIDDERVSSYAYLTDVDYRLATESEIGVFMAEGELVIARALAAGHTPMSCLVSRSKLESVRHHFAERDVPVFVASDDLLAAVTGYHVHRGALVAFARPKRASIAEVCRGVELVVVLEDLVDHTNVGAIFRSAAALGAGAVVISPRCADPLYRRALKVSMGATAMLPWARAQVWPGALSELTALGFTTIGMTPAGDTELGKLANSMRPALVFGTEGAGLSPAAMAHCAVLSRIEMANDVDSLNVAATAAVACYAMRGSTAEVT